MTAVTEERSIITAAMEKLEYYRQRPSWKWRVLGVVALFLDWFEHWAESGNMFEVFTAITELQEDVAPGDPEYLPFLAIAVVAHTMFFLGFAYLVFHEEPETPPPGVPTKKVWQYSHWKVFAAVGLGMDVLFHAFVLGRPSSIIIDIPFSVAPFWLATAGLITHILFLVAFGYILFKRDTVPADDQLASS